MVPPSTSWNIAAEPTVIPQATAHQPYEDAEATVSLGVTARRPDDSDVTGIPGAMVHGPNDGPLHVGQAFGARYRIIRLLGMGGMGAVYQAWDAELGVAVAIKVILPEATADPRAAADLERRFKRELLLARQVTHKHVVRIHDLGTIDGVKYITMTYVDGTDVATILKAKQRIPVSETLRIARQVVSGLVAAHAAGVVHRDLKPANIMVGADGQPLIMDFGIASSTAVAAVSPAGLAGGLSSSAWTVSTHIEATMNGAVVGTVEYMAPEQARAETVDQRADVYAFGLILYDMLSGGGRAKRAGSALEELKARMAHSPPAIGTLVPGIPQALAELISRCLEPDPSRRFQTSKDLEDALARLDENGEPIPVRRTVGLRMMAAIVAVLAAIAAAAVWVVRPPPPPVEHAPVSVVIADFDNRTSDPTFDRALEPTLKRALEGASFISAFDRSGIASVLGVRPPERLDETAARELAVAQGLGVVLSGSLERTGDRYTVSAKAAETVTGTVIQEATGNVTGKDAVLGAATELMATVRRALGDTSDSAQIFAMASLSATSLDVVRHHAAAMEAMSNNQFDAALDNASKAVALDPEFGIGYQVMAVAARNLGRLQDAEKFVNEALRHLDGMTERERYSTRGFFYRVTGDYAQCVKEYGDLLARFNADVVARNQVALCSSKLRDLGRAVTEMRTVVERLPNRSLFRDNLALYANYAGDFQTAEQEARAIKGPDAYASLALAFAQLGQDQLPAAIETYRTLGTINALGTSFSVLGLADAAAYAGRFSEAARILEQGAAADVKAGNGDRAGVKLVSLASAHLQHGLREQAIKAAEQALTRSQGVKIRFLAGRTFAEAGEIERARPLAAALSAEFQTEPQAFGKILEGTIALREGDARRSVQLLNEANALLDTWIGHFDLGRAYLDAGQFARADSEFDRCIKRRGEALSLFLDEEATYAYLPPVYYFQGRAREGLKNDGFAQSYRAYIQIRGQSTEDPLLPEVRRRAGQATPK
jgi:tetratricopeptide (TPR) repeat protein/tRNA A-37 threonylcarbamoyl transferase component Bud32